MMKYFERGEVWTEHGCLWSIPTNNEYPVQPWYLFPNAPWFPEDWPPENYTNANFIKFVLNYFDKNSKIYNNVYNIIDYRLSFMSKLSNFFTFAKSDIEQTIETNDWIEFIRCLQKYNLKSNDECVQLFTELLNIMKPTANQDVYENCNKIRII
ncbi:hypothetical protein [Lachnotalea glycerini]|nr:hypothetical protein [Lachnotalea glycerini]